MSSDTSHSTPHVLPLKVYLSVGGALLVLTLVTITVAQIQLGAWNMVVALTIASIKVLLVAFFFMHLYYDYKLYFIAFAVGLLIFTVFIVLTMFDTLNRGEIYEIKAEHINPKAVIYDNPMTGGHEGAKFSDTTKAAAAQRTTDSSKAKSDSATHSVSPTH